MLSVDRLPNGITQVVCFVLSAKVNLNVVVIFNVQLQKSYRSCILRLLFRRGYRGV